MKTKKEIRFILNALSSAYPDGICSLQYTKDYELLFATRLAAQCTDARVNQVTPVLFSRYPTLQALAAADPEELSQIIHPCGFFRIKARDILAASAMLLDAFGGRVPDNMEDLLRLPGVGRKTANLILGDIYQKPAIVADTHCIRLSGRIGLTDGSRDPYQVELQLSQLIPPAEQSDFCHRLVLHGREICKARSPRCGACILASVCDENKTEFRKK
ncbi:MAG: endonuclease III [Oscillospiraceae bacterium]|nr:endonuclease III [Oscillospiraceae bacterium]